MAKHPMRSTINLPEHTVMRIRLASKFLNVWAGELVDMALDNYGIPHYGKSPDIRDLSVNRLEAHLDYIRHDGLDEAMENYFKRESANDNEV